MLTLIANGVRHDPRFYPHLELVTDYEWGNPARPARTVKTFAISAIPPGYAFKKERVMWPIQLGQMPVTQLTTFESAIAEIS